MKNPHYKRDLTDAELQFVKEAKESCFEVCYQEDGTPYAMGATDNGRCFSGDVEEHKEADGEGSCYYLKK